MSCDGGENQPQEPPKRLCPLKIDKLQNKMKAEKYRYDSRLIQGVHAIQK
jgi:hypothetical protein